jgi:hypothetical protein
MPKQEMIDEKPITKEITVSTKAKKAIKDMDQSFKWWLAESDDQLCQELLSTTNYLTKIHQVRIRQASIYTRLYSGKPLYNYLANVGSLDNSQQLPIGRPTANVVYACTDTLVSKASQEKPKPIYQGNDAHYKERKLAMQINDFVQGEFFRAKAYELGVLAFRDSCILGNGFIKVYPQIERDSKGKAIKGKVCLERTIETELLTDYNDAYYGNPRNLIQKKLVDRGVMIAMIPDKADLILKAHHGNVDNTPLSTDTISDQFIIAEGWHLPSSPNADDGRHVWVCSAGVLLDEPWTKEKFPFVKWSYNPNVVGWFAQGLAEILMPGQMEIYKALIIASQSLELMGVPRILIDEFSAILETAFNTNIGTIIKYNKVKPEFVNAQANNPELYEWIKWNIQNCFQMAGISSLSATGQKPAGLNSGEAQRAYMDIQTDRYAALMRRNQEAYTELAMEMTHCAAEIKKETGSYLTVYPGRDGTREVDLPDIDVLDDTFVFQCAEESSLPNDPAGRQAKLSEMLAAGEITTQEFRRLSSFPDLKQSDELANALEERILENLDAIIDEGKAGYEPPDVFILDPTDLATKLTVNYINKYAVTDIEESKMQLLRDYFTQVQNLKQQANPPPPPMAPPGAAPGQGPLPVAPPAPSMAPTSGAQV